jgi:hypothetical protein
VSDKPNYGCLVFLVYLAFALGVGVGLAIMNAVQIVRAM